jgi:chromosome segregation ATPase
VQINALQASHKWQAASRDAAISSSKAAAAGQAAVIAQLQEDCAAKDATTARQAAAIDSLKTQIKDLQGQLGRASYDAGKWQAVYAALKTQAESKYAALVQDSEAAIDKWEAHCQELQQQAAKESEALRKRCTELTSRLSRLQTKQANHEEVLVKSEQLLTEYNRLCERLHRRDATIYRQRKQLQQLGNMSGAAVVAAKYENAYRNAHRVGSVPPRIPCKSRLSSCRGEATG